MEITIHYGQELDLGASQFPDLDVDATNRAWCRHVETFLDGAFGEENTVTVEYHPHEHISPHQKIEMDAILPEDDNWDFLSILEDAEDNAMQEKYAVAKSE